MNSIMHHAVRTNFAEKAAYVAHLLPTMTVAEHETFIAIDCGLPSDTFNVIVARNLLATDQLLQQGVEHFMAKRFPVALWYWEDEADQHGMNALTHYGLAHSETHIAMYADLTQAHVPVLMPAGLTIHGVTRADEIRHYSSVIERLFGDSDEGRQVATYHALLSGYMLSTFPALQYYIGSYRDEVVATGSLFIGSETIGIYDIVTTVEYRHKGIGSAMFAYLVNEAQQAHHRYAVLQASPGGLRIYEKAGFTSVGKVHTFENRVLL